MCVISVHVFISVGFCTVFVSKCVCLHLRPCACVRVKCAPTIR